MRLIDADALRECYTDLDDNLKVPVAICKVNIDSMPTIEEVEKERGGRMTITVITDKNTYVFDNAQEAFIKETNLSIKQSDEEFGRGFIITEDDTE